MLITFKTKFILIPLCLIIFITYTDITGKVLLRNEIFKSYITDIQVEAFFLKTKSRCLIWTLGITNASFGFSFRWNYFNAKSGQIEHIYISL